MPDAVVQVGIVLPHPVVLVGLRAAEPKLGVAGHVGGLGAEAAHQLAMRLLQRPQPGGVDVGMSDRRELVHHRGVATHQQALEDVGCLVPGAPVVLDPHVAEAVQLGQELARPGWVEPVGSVGLEPPQHVEVVVKLPCLGIEASDVAAVEHDRLDCRVGPVERAELAVACEFDAQLELLAPGGLLDQQRIGTRSFVAGVEPLDRAATDPERRLRVGDPQQIDPVAGPLGWHRRLDPKPERRPQRPELLAQLGVAIGKLLGLLQRDPIDRARHHQAVGITPLGIDHAPRSARPPGRCACGCRRDGEASSPDDRGRVSVR